MYGCEKPNWSRSKSRADRYENKKCFTPEISQKGLVLVFFSQKLHEK